MGLTPTAELVDNPSLTQLIQEAEDEPAETLVS
jgi:hypothetical protein